ncbi:hypothetical protein GCM10027589_55530 [Actinocorallia lasiicapitis]
MEQWLPDDGPRWRGPLLAGLVAALLTALLVVGYVFWKNEDDGSGNLAADPGTSATKEDKPAAEQPSDDSGDKEPSGDAKAQATAVDDILADMTSSRKKLSSISYTCADKSDDLSTFRKAITERKQQLDDADALDVGALDQGDELKSALKSALQTSIDANEQAVEFLEDEGGCDGDAADRLQDWNDKAGAAKTKFLDLWNKVAADHDLPDRKREDI